MATNTGVDPDAIWEWAFIERVSTGLLLSRLTHPEADGYIATANALPQRALVDADPTRAEPGQVVQRVHDASMPEPCCYR